MKSAHQVVEVAVGMCSEWTGMEINDAARVAENKVQWRGFLRSANPSYGGWSTALNDDEALQN